MNIDGPSAKLVAINQLAAELEKTELFRGITYAIHQGQPYSTNNPKTYPIDNSKDTFNALKAMCEEKKGTFPIMWGFRQYTPGESLSDKEMHTLKTFAEMFEGVKKLGIEVHTPLMLADSHAEHNGVLKEGPEGFQAYYDKVKEEAEKLGLPTVWLSNIFDTLQITSHDIEEHGKQLIRKREQLDIALEKPEANIPGTPENDLKKQAKTPGTEEYRLRNITTLTDKEFAAFKGQRRNMVMRYPQTNAEFLKQSNRIKEASYGQKGVEYAQFRAGEGEMLLPNLSKYFATKGVLPVHVAEPEAAKIGVRGLSIHSKDKDNNNVANIPWKGDDVVEKEQAKKSGNSGAMSGSSKGNAKQNNLTPEQLQKLQKQEEAKARQREKQLASKQAKLKAAQAQKKDVQNGSSASSASS